MSVPSVVPVGLAAVSGTEVRRGIASAEGWPVHSALSGLLPGGLPHGGALVVSGSVSLLLAAMGAASAQGAWCALTGLPPIGAEAAAQCGMVLERTPVVTAPRAAASGRTWAGLLAALIDTVDIVGARPAGMPSPAEMSQLAARARTKGATLLLYLDAGARWPGAGLHLAGSDRVWWRADGPRGRLAARQLTVTVQGRGRLARADTTTLWLPAHTGGIGRAAAASPAAPLARVR